MTPVEVVFISALLFSLALNGILGVNAIRAADHLEDVQNKLWQMHLEKNPVMNRFESGEVVKQPCTGTHMNGFRTQGNVVFLNNANQRVD